MNELLPINTASVRKVWFEYKPWVGAHTTWDCFISYQDGDDRKGFVAIEVKFTESLNPSLQFKREHLLAQSLLDSGVYDEGYFVAIASAMNYHVQEAAEAYQAQLREPKDGTVRFANFTLEEIIAVIRLWPKHSREKLLWRVHSSSAYG